MGDNTISRLISKEENQNFIIALLKDLHCLKYMLENDWFEKDPIRIGAEQEMVFVDEYFRPNPIGPEIIKKFRKADWLTSELSKFNLEINLTPQLFEGHAFTNIENEVRGHLDTLAAALEKHKSQIVLTGILPTLRKYDLNMKNLFPKRRYRSLLSAINAQRGSRQAYDLRLRGIDELVVRHDSPLLEACNTSFQVHLQVRPDEFQEMYNIAQILTGPTLAISANSAVVFGRRLWHETRIALFQQSIDTRTIRDHMREMSPRVILGKHWLNKSIVELFQEDIARFRVLVGTKNIEDSIELVKEGKIPTLKALQVHNGTVYRWNRPCYGISDSGMPHLRIENRVLPAGPTVIDEMANMAFWLGAMKGLHNEYGDIRKHIEFVDLRDNFAKSARYGIDSTFNWVNDQKISVTELLEKELIPLAREGLQSQNIAPDDIDRLMGVMEERTEKHMTGARWMLRSFSSLKNGVDKEMAQTILTSAMVKNQKSEKPIHQWPFPRVEEFKVESMIAYNVSECMITDIFTVRQDDVIEMVAEMMIWKHIKQVPVEDKKGNLVGIVSYKQIIEAFLKQKHDGIPILTVGDIMEADPLVIGPEVPVRKAIEKMVENQTDALVVANEKNELLGLISEMEILSMVNRYLHSQTGDGQE
ncbi:CBS domain-containing protein [Membranihabitans maritimus]|uniref:CBS domain-containing protein n=1 Tax=Membranihabitans maritimus TaxID=2904244 RepID=UPI001F371499|nr:CBS domain-containing protein [Membranihabitans maritimus]